MLEFLRVLFRSAAERSREKVFCDDAAVSTIPVNFTEEELEEFYIYWDND